MRRIICIDSKTMVLKNGTSVFNFVVVDAFSEDTISFGIALTHGPEEYKKHTRDFIELGLLFNRKMSEITIITDMPQEYEAHLFSDPDEKFNIIYSTELCDSFTDPVRAKLSFNPTYQHMIATLEKHSNL